MLSRSERAEDTGHAWNMSGHLGHASFHSSAQASFESNCIRPIFESDKENQEEQDTVFVYQSLLNPRWGMNYKRQYGTGNAAMEVSASTLGVKGTGESAPRIPQGFVGLVMFNQDLGCVY